MQILVLDFDWLKDFLLHFQLLWLLDQLFCLVFQMFNRFFIVCDFAEQFSVDCLFVEIFGHECLGIVDSLNNGFFTVAVLISLNAN